MNINPEDWPFEDLHLQWHGLESNSYDLNATNGMITIDTHALWIIYRGSGTIIVGRERIALREGHCVLFAPGTRVEFGVGREQTLHVYSLTFAAGMRGGHNESQMQILSYFQNRAIAVTPFSPLLSILETMTAGKEASTGLEKFRRSILLQEVLYTFLDKACTGTPSNSKEAVEYTISYIQEHYNRKLNIKDLSAMAEVGQRQYSHIFKQMTGTSPMDYVHRVRMEQAKKLLLTSGRDMLSC